MVAEIDFLPFEHMDNPQASAPAFLSLVVFLAVWMAVAYYGIRAKQSKILSIGGGFILGLLGVMGLVTLTSEHKDSATPTKEQAVTSAPETSLADHDDEAVSDEDIPTNAWLRLDKGTRKTMAEQKYQDAEKLSGEMVQLLEAANNGRLSADVIGRISIWKGNVRSVLKEVEQTECHRSFSSSATAMGKVHSALENMTFAWDALEKFGNASTERDRSTYASMHANHLKLVKECLHESREWMSEGEF
jgi:hypothetical protein